MTHSSPQVLSWASQAVDSRPTLRHRCIPKTPASGLRGGGCCRPSFSLQSFTWSALLYPSNQLNMLARALPVRRDSRRRNQGPLKHTQQKQSSSSSSSSSSDSSQVGTKSSTSNSQDVDWQAQKCHMHSTTIRSPPSLCKSMGRQSTAALERKCPAQHSLAAGGCPSYFQGQCLWREQHSNLLRLQGCQRYTSSFTPGSPPHHSMYSTSTTAKLAKRAAGLFGGTSIRISLDRLIRQHQRSIPFMQAVVTHVLCFNSPAASCCCRCCSCCTRAWCS